eukprot:jgi/Chlat1/5300/Chrsp35S05245
MALAWLLPACCLAAKLKLIAEGQGEAVTVSLSSETIDLSAARTHARGHAQAACSPPPSKPRRSNAKALWKLGPSQQDTQA